MDHTRPTWLEVRNLFPTGYLALIGLLIADTTVGPTADLWHKPWFLSAIGISALLIAVGLFGFIAHYKWRSLPLALIAGAVPAVILHMSPLILGALGICIFFATLFFLHVNNSDSTSGDIDSLREKLVAAKKDADDRTQERNAAQAQQRAAEVQADTWMRELKKSEHMLGEAATKISVLEADKDPGPIYYEQTFALGLTDPRRSMFGQNTETIRRLNPKFQNVDDFEKAKRQRDDAQEQLGACKKERDEAREQATAAIRQRDDCSAALKQARKERDDAKCDVDVRVVIDNLTVDRSGHNPVVVADVSVTNYGEPASVDQWQMLYWHNGKKKETGRQDLQHNGWVLQDQRLVTLYGSTWGFDDYIGKITKKPLAKGEKRRGFFWAELCDSPDISEADIRTAYMQYQAENKTFESQAVGANLQPGQIKAIL